MKKLFVFAIIGLCLLSTLFFNSTVLPLFNFDGVEKVCFVSANQYESSDFDSVPCGDKFFNYCSLETAKKSLEDVKENIDGIQFYLNSEDVDSVLNALKATFIYSETVGDVLVYYAYTTFYDDCVFVNGRKINVQIATYQDKLIVGFPMILTGF